MPEPELIDRREADNRPRPRLGITLGDFNGIGPEVMYKTLADPRILRFCIPVVFASLKILRRLRRTFTAEDINFQLLHEGQAPHPRRANLQICWEEDWDVNPGQASEASGRAALISLEKATRQALNGQLEGIVTAPISKVGMPAEFAAAGHTGYLAREAGNIPVLMLMAGEVLRVAVATEHIPLGRVAGQLTPALVEEKIKLLSASLRHDFDIAKPRIAVLGLNPHAGEDGMLGREEKEWLAPLVQGWPGKTEIVIGPLPADGFFGRHLYRRFDGVLAMYHDQGLIPFKTLSGQEGVNFTAGLPFVRTSPAHGTAFDLAGKDMAEPDSFRAALLMAADVASRKMQPAY